MKANSAKHIILAPEDAASITELTPFRRFDSRLTDAFCCISAIFILDDSANVNLHESKNLFQHN